MRYRKGGIDLKSAQDTLLLQTDLVEKIDSFVQQYNRSHRPFICTATADSIL